MIPQIIVVCLMTLVLGINLAKHGEPKDSNYDFFWSILSVSIWVSTLYMGGFFNVFIK